MHWPDYMAVGRVNTPAPAHSDHGQSYTLGSFPSQPCLPSSISKRTQRKKEKRDSVILYEDRMLYRQRENKTVLFWSGERTELFTTDLHFGVILGIWIGALSGCFIVKKPVQFKKNRISSVLIFVSENTIKTDNTAAADGGDTVWVFLLRGAADIFHCDLWLDLICDVMYKRKPKHSHWFHKQQLLL